MRMQEEPFDRRDLIPSGLERIQGRFDEEQLSVMLEASSHCPGIWQIAADNPCLAWMLACYDRFVPNNGKLHWEALHERLGFRRRELLGWLGWPQEESCVRLLSKIRMPEVAVEDLLLLRDACHEGRADSLRHVPEIKVEIIRIATDPELAEMVSPSFYIHLARVDCFERPPSEDLRYVIEVSRLRWYSKKEFPSPLFSVPRHAQPSGVCLEPFHSIGDFYRWAQEQKNCLFSLIDDVFAGRVFLLKILKPERGTVSLVKDPANGWRIRDIEAAANRSVSKRTLCEIAGYLNRLLDREKPL